jgi:transcriptional regulator GlxA family with amidase domain
MKLAYIIFDGITWLDLIGVYDPVSRLRSMNYLPSLSWDICSYTETASDHLGLQMTPQKVKESLARYDAILVPGGIGTRTLRSDADFLSWISTAAPVKYKMSVCSGSLILGAAGFLTTKKATTNYTELETLKPYCKEVVDERVVVDGNVITAGAVSASIDLGLLLCEMWAGPEARNAIKKKMNYRD